MFPERGGEVGEGVESSHPGNLRHIVFPLLQQIRGAVEFIALEKNSRIFPGGGDGTQLPAQFLAVFYQANTFVAVEEVAAAKEFSAVLNGSDRVTGGNLYVNISGDIYYFSGLLTTAGSKELQCNYRGKLNFEIGVDDPEASGYTIVFSASLVFETDMMGNGWVIPGFMVGGTRFVDKEGVLRYVTAGTVSVATADYEGTKLYSFSGTNVSTINETGEDAGTTSFEIKYVTLK